ncbi:MAG: hypothetical protein PHU12_00615 [Candidatus Aenigmarchaeota archaeon]|nr:hypothetical protein [Candidatus Aenigmarchaeota archaeon]
MIDMRIWICAKCGEEVEFPDEDEEILEMDCPKCRKMVKVKKGKIVR